MVVAWMHRSSAISAGRVLLQSDGILWALANVAITPSRPLRFSSHLRQGSAAPLGRRPCSLLLMLYPACRINSARALLLFLSNRSRPISLKATTICSILLRIMLGPSYLTFCSSLLLLYHAHVDGKLKWALRFLRSSSSFLPAIPPWRLPNYHDATFPAGSGVHAVDASRTFLRDR